ncbi:MAG: hypothetical protein V4616_05715 [Bacteroidota bacterium]
MRTVLIAWLLACCGCLAAQEQTFSSKIWLEGYVLSADSSLFTGQLIDYWPSGRVKRTAKVEQGYLSGNTKEFYETGQLRYIKQYNRGKLSGMMTEYFRNGELKMQCEVGKQSRMGGNDVTNLLYAYYNNGEYINKVKGRARIVFMTADKLSDFYNDHLALHLQDGYRIFDNSSIDYGIFIEDSRRITSPEFSNQVKMPMKEIKN